MRKCQNVRQSKLGEAVCSKIPRTDAVEISAPGIRRFVLRLKVN
jgi:hypothetical protein